MALLILFEGPGWPSQLRKWSSGHWPLESRAAHQSPPHQVGMVSGGSDGKPWNSIHRQPVPVKKKSTSSCGCVPNASMCERPSFTSFTKLYQALPSFTKLYQASARTDHFWEQKECFGRVVLANQSQLELGPAAKKRAVSKCASNHGDQPHLQVAPPKQFSWKSPSEARPSLVTTEERLQVLQIASSQAATVPWPPHQHWLWMWKDQELCLLFGLTAMGPPGKL